MLRTNFIGTILVIVLGVNIGAWTLSVATKPGVRVTSLSIPIGAQAIGAQAIDAQSQAASVAATQDTRVTNVQPATGTIDTAASMVTSGNDSAASSGKSATTPSVNSAHSATSTLSTSTNEKPTLVQ